MPRIIGRRILLALNIAALVVISGMAIQKYLMPLAAISVHKAEYKKLVFACDNVMRDHFIAKAWVTKAPSEETSKSLRAAEVGLITCHEYDVLRKTLLTWGVSEHQLALL